MIEAMISEIEFRKSYLQESSIQTIYFGGGTPSILDENELHKLLASIQTHFSINEAAEITLEANPEDFTEDQADIWRRAGINRLSIGIQGFQDDMLRAWNRSHDTRQALEAIQISLRAGINNISADLIYGDPLLSDEAWKANIQTLIDYGVPHLSCYALTVESGTALHHQITNGKTKPLDEEQSYRQYAILQELMKENGYLHYEISNFALPGYHSKHNTSYWQGIHYLGIGPSAHSFDGMSRQWNIANNSKYIQLITSGELPAEIEELTKEKRYNEWIMTGLRTSWGIDPSALEKLDPGYPALLEKNTQSYLKDGRIIKTAEGHYVLAPDQYFFADGIAADLFLV